MFVGCPLFNIILNSKNKWPLELSGLFVVGDILNDFFLNSVICFIYSFIALIFVGVKFTVFCFGTKDSSIPFSSLG